MYVWSGRDGYRKAWNNQVITDNRDYSHMYYIEDITRLCRDFGIP